jgi:hypothetical protein
MRALLVNLQIVQDVGPVHAVIHAVMMANDSGDGAEMSHKEIATEANVTVATTRRYIGKLVDLGHVKIDNQIEHMVGQRVNRYQVPTWLTPDPPAHSEQAYMESGYKVEERREDKVDNDSSLELSISCNQVGDPPATDADDVLDDEDSLVPPPIRWLPMGSPMPMLDKPKVGKKGPFKAYIEAIWLVSHVEAYVLEKSSQERLAKGWKAQKSIPKKRKIAWLKHAEILLANHDLAEVREITDWVFTECKGLLPFDVVDWYGKRRKDGERKVTSVRKLLENYDDLRAAWSLGKTTHTRQLDYHKPLSDEAMESSVTDLVATFEDFRKTYFSLGYEVHTSERWEWTKQFRRLLDEHHLDVAELTEVIDGLKRYRGGMDYIRYASPRTLHYDATEWKIVRMRLLECREDEELSRRSQPAWKTSSKSLWDTGDDREIAAAPPSGERPSQDREGRWYSEPWSERCTRIIAKQDQDAARAAAERPGHQSLTKRIEAALAASRTRRDVA